MFNTLKIDGSEDMTSRAHLKGFIVYLFLHFGYQVCETHEFHE